MTPCPAILIPTRPGARPARPLTPQQRIDRYEEERARLDETEEQLMRRQAEGYAVIRNLIDRHRRVPRHRALVVCN